jgi:oxygen-independent coproporphyrinogen-3 oxidase
MTGHLYVHVPFCRRKCAYCAFYSEADASPATIDHYLRHLAAECRAAAAQAGPLRTLYLGGGTPTHLDANRLRILLTTLRQHFRLASGAEASSEGNPGSLDDEKAEVLAAAGINRVSLGVQSFRPEFRRRLGRYGPAPIRRAVARLRRHGIGRLGIDLIYGIPGQTLADWAAELAMAIDLGVGHVSAYALTREEGTRLARRCRRTGDAPDDDLLADMWHLAGERLATAGLQRYEISNYARPGEECRHNQAVWHGEPHLGIGPAAAAFDGETRWSHPANLAQWLGGTPPREDRLSRCSRAREILAFGLRTAEGWDEPRCRRATGRAWHAWQDRLQPLIEAGLLAVDGSRLQPTTRGLLLWDSIAEAII